MFGELINHKPHNRRARIQRPRQMKYQLKDKDSDTLLIDWFEEDNDGDKLNIISIFVLPHQYEGCPQTTSNDLPKDLQLQKIWELIWEWSRSYT